MILFVRWWCRTVSLWIWHVDLLLFAVQISLADVVCLLLVCRISCLLVAFSGATCLYCDVVCLLRYLAIWLGLLVCCFLLGCGVVVVGLLVILWVACVAGCLVCLLFLVVLLFLL